MLVLLIIFLITIPVVTQSVAMQLPAEDQHRATQTKPENIIISVKPRRRRVLLEHAAGGDMAKRCSSASRRFRCEPAARVHIRGDRDGRYESMGASCSPASARRSRMAFEAEPPPKDKGDHHEMNIGSGSGSGEPGT